MNGTHEELYNQIKNLLDKNIDAHRGYLKAADGAKNQDIKVFFKQKATSRNLFNEKLISELQYSFDFPKIEGSSLSGIMHRVWLDTKDMFLGSNEIVMLKESLRTDKIILKEYEELLKYSRLPLSIRFILKEQATIIKLDMHKIEQMINAYK